jgi:hypothetical protein
VVLDSIPTSKLMNLAVASCEQATVGAKPRAGTTRAGRARRTFGICDDHLHATVAAGFLFLKIDIISPTRLVK